MLTLVRDLDRLIKGEGEAGVDERFGRLTGWDYVVSESRIRRSGTLMRLVYCRCWCYLCFVIVVGVFVVAVGMVMVMPSGRALSLRHERLVAGLSGRSNN